MRAEFEARQAQGPLGGLLGGAAGQGGGAAAPSFDMAGFLAGSQGQQRSASGSGGNGGKKARK